MKNHVFGRRILQAAIVAVLLSLAAAGLGSRFLADPRGGGATPDGSVGFTASAAAQTGAGSAVYAYDEVESMVRGSKAVVVGRVLSNECHLLPDKKQVETVYTVEVQQVFKGDLASNDKIEVSTPGGLVLLKGDGTEVNKKNKLKDVKEEDRVVIAAQPGYGVVNTGRPLPGVASMRFVGHAEQMPMVNDQTYLLFLDKSGAVYSLTPAQQAYAGLRGANAMADLSQSVLDNVRLAVERETGSR